MNVCLSYAKPIVNFTPCTNGITAIIATEMQRFQYAIWENYIQIDYGFSPQTSPVGGFSGLYSWENFDCLDVHSDDRSFNSKEDVMRTIIDALLEGRYIFVGYDRFYLPACVQYKKEHRNHDMMIFGVDTARNSFYCADFLSNKYSKFEARIEDICEAIYHYSLDAPRELNMDKIHFIKLSNEKAREVSVPRIVTSIDKLLHPDFPSCEQIGYGLGFFNHLAKLTYDETNKINLLVAYHLICEHVRLMKLRVRYLVSLNIGLDGSLLNELDDISIAAQKVRNGYIKHRLKNDVCEHAKPLEESLLTLQSDYEVVLNKIKKNLV